MPIRVQCPNPACGKAGSLSDDHIGKPVRCPQCGTLFTLSGAAGVSPGAAGVAPAQVAPDSEPLRDSPATIGRFQIRARLGAGAFGTVYRAYDPQLGQEIALKLARAETLDSPPRVQRFFREAKVAANLRHAHIVPVYEAGSEGNQFYIASAFIEGSTLADSLEDNPPDCRRAAQIVHDLAEALAYAHDQGIVHRDVKPANIMMDGRGEVHLMDFGLAYCRDGRTKLTRVGSVLGSPGYMAPEQARGKGEDTLPASDQYSLGVVLYELLCGEKPFCGPPDIVLFNTIHQPPAAPRSVRPEVPAELEVVCLRALAKRPEDRYANCWELAWELEKWLERERVKTASPQSVRARSESKEFQRL